MTLPIPPIVDDIGPIADVRDEIVARVAANTNADANDEWVGRAVDDAIGYVIDYTNRSAVGLPADATTVNGIVGYATRIYLDAWQPNGVGGALVDPTFEPIFRPSFVFREWRSKFLRLYVRWGVA